MWEGSNHVIANVRDNDQARHRVIWREFNDHEVSDDLPDRILAADAGRVSALDVPTAGQPRRVVVRRIQARVLL
jgi:hypothetical protein